MKLKEKCTPGTLIYPGRVDPGDKEIPGVSKGYPWHWAYLSSIYKKRQPSGIPQVYPTSTWGVTRGKWPKRLCTVQKKKYIVNSQTTLSSANLSTVYPSQVAFVCCICLLVLNKLNVQYSSYSYSICYHSVLYWTCFSSISYSPSVTFVTFCFNEFLVPLQLRHVRTLLVSAIILLFSLKTVVLVHFCPKNLTKSVLLPTGKPSVVYSGSGPGPYILGHSGPGRKTRKSYIKKIRCVHCTVCT